MIKVGWAYLCRMKRSTINATNLEVLFAFSTYTTWTKFDSLFLWKKVNQFNHRNCINKNVTQTYAASQTWNFIYKLWNRIQIFGENLRNREWSPNNIFWLWGREQRLSSYLPHSWFQVMKTGKLLVVFFNPMFNLHSKPPWRVAFILRFS